jgi:hypothetical protein
MENVMEDLKQSYAEVVRIAKDWEELYAPANLACDARTATLLLEWVLSNEGIASFSGFNHAVEALGAQVLYQDAPQKTAEQIAEEGNAKMRADYMKSIAPQESFDARVKVETAKRKAADAAKAQEKAKGELRTTIDSYECYKTNGSGKDYPSTEMIRRELTAVISRNADGTRDFVRNLVVVKQIIQELPDHPASGDVARTLASIHARLK